MKYNFSTINSFFIITLLISHMNLSSMLDKYKEATAYNHSNKLLFLPHVAYSAFSQGVDTNKPIETIIEPLLSFSTICKKLTPLLFPKIITTICQSYDIKKKDAAMKNLLARIDHITYKDNREKALFLTYAGAHNDAHKEFPLLERAIKRQDNQMITALFNNNADPNQISDEYTSPNFFYITTVSMAQIFVDNNVNLNQPNIPTLQDCIPNVLWACILYGHSLELIKFYLNHKVDVATKSTNKDCLLHHLVRSLHYQFELTNHVQIATLFLTIAPEIINTINIQRITPLDSALQSLKDFKEFPENIEICLQLIELFKNYGGKTAQELQNIDKVENKNDPIHKNQDKEDTCCICYENANNLMLIPCINTHPDLICLDYHNTPSLELCPLCRTKLNKKL